MSDEQNSAPGSDFDVQRLSQQWMTTIEKSSALVTDFVGQQKVSNDLVSNTFDTEALAAFQSLALEMATDPFKLAKAQVDFWTGMTNIWINTAARMVGQDLAPARSVSQGDRRFKDDAWEESAVFDYIKQSYLLVSDLSNEITANCESASPEQKRKMQFLSRQYVSAMSPSNFLLSNPAVLKKTMETGGENLIAGLNNVLGDLEKGSGKLNISMTDADAFEVGGNIANTPGKIIFKNELFELIQYSPATEQVHRVPMLFVPPWINKFYVLDLRPENSLIKWVVDQGYTLFVISWVNPDESAAETKFSDYMHKGVLTALDKVEEVTGEEHANVLGFCIGGILVTTALAYLAGQGNKRIISATLLATMIDLTNVGEMSVFVEPEQVKALQSRVTEKGYLEGSEMAGMFNMMRENDLIWSFVVNNYLLGKDPVPFDLLYWNSDSTRLPARMIVEYLTDFYRDNAFMNPGTLTIDEQEIDVGLVTTPTYMLATKDDHIAPWTSCYRGVTRFAGPTKFVLGASGHIAGIVNPPAKNKYCFWLNDSADKVEDADEWFSSAERHDGSWWVDWGGWLASNSGEMVDAREPGDNEIAVLYDAPGEYVRVRSG